MAARPATIGQLRADGWVSKPVKEEIRANAVTRIGAGEPLFERVIGYEQTVLPQLENALLAGHDVIFLGERGQAKTRMIRSLTGLLDEWMPIIAGSEINDDPYAPVSRHARDLVHEHGEDTPVTWVHRDDRFGEKLATPDTSIADLIGEVDPIKVAEGRYLSDELTLHYGLVPRTNRGIFAINELPDLAERIQVGLLNVLEERDIQVRGYKIRLPLDIMLVASANPEDYTNRGRIITPLKDRFGSQIRTHYPLEVSTELDIVRQEARSPSVGGVDVRMPTYLAEVITTLSHLARASTHVNQRSGVSVRLSVTNYEVVSANALRRALRTGERVVVPRVDDLEALGASSSGKIEIESLDEGREGAIFENLVKAAVLTVFKERVAPEQTRDVVSAVRGGRRRPHRRGRPVGRPRRPRRVGPGAAAAGRRPDRRRRVAGRGRRRGVVRARGPAPVEAAEQGLLGHQRHVPQPQLTTEPSCQWIPRRSARFTLTDRPPRVGRVVQRDVQAEPVAAGGRGARRVRQDQLLDAPRQLHGLVLVELQAEPGVLPDAGRSGGDDLGAQGVDRGDDAGELVVEVGRRQDPRLAGAPIGLLQGPPLPAARRVGLQEPGRAQRADVVQDRRRVLVEAVGELLVGQRLVQAEADDAQPQRVGHGLELRRRRVTAGRVGRDPRH